MKFRLHLKLNRKVDLYKVKYVPLVPLQELIRCKKWQIVTVSYNTK